MFKIKLLLFKVIMFVQYFTCKQALEHFLKSTGKNNDVSFDYCSQES